MRPVNQLRCVLLCWWLGLFPLAFAIVWFAINRMHLWQLTAFTLLCFHAIVICMVYRYLDVKYRDDPELRGVRKKYWNE